MTTCVVVKWHVLARWLCHTEEKRLSRITRRLHNYFSIRQGFMIYFSGYDKVDNEDLFLMARVWKDRTTSKNLYINHNHIKIRTFFLISQSFYLSTIHQSLSIKLSVFEHPPKFAGPNHSHSTLYSISLPRTTVLHTFTINQLAMCADKYYHTTIWIAFIHESETEKLSNESQSSQNIRWFSVSKCADFVRGGWLFSHSSWLLLGQCILE